MEDDNTLESRLKKMEQMIKQLTIEVNSLRGELKTEISYLNVTVSQKADLRDYN